MQSISKGFIIPPRSTMDLLSSAFRSGWSLILNQGPRESLKVWMDKGVINERVLLRADFGLARMLTLYDDLESPILKKYGFDAEEFMKGVKPALEQFHNVQRELKNSLNGPIIAADAGTSADSSTNAESASVDGTEPAYLVDEHQMAALTALTGLSHNNKDMKHLLKFDWQKEAKEKPNSLAGHLFAMVTPEFFDLIQVGSKTAYLLDRATVYQEESGEVHNLCLLSARSMVMDNSKQANEFAVRDDELNVSEDAADNAEKPEEEDRLPVAAQVEVLYTIDETFNRQSKSKDPKSEDNEETFRRTAVAVGVFEGWLNGDPSGNKELRWKLSMNRPAWEFRLLD